MQQKFPTARKLLKEKGIADDSPTLKKCPEWLKIAYLTDINFCEHSNCKDKDLEIHRKRRKYKGGLYNPDNVKIACSNHHRYYHANEFNNCKSK